MGKKIWALLLFCSILYGNESRILFLSFERGGTHWALYCLCKLLDRQVSFCTRNSVIDIFDGEFEKNKEGRIYAAHCPKDLKITANSNDFLLVIVRNYRENLIRNFMDMDFVLAKIYQEAHFQKFGNNTNKTYVYDKHHYFHVLRCYDEWDPSRRFLIYYEDLIEQPETVLKQLLNFLQMEKKKKNLNEFLRNIEQHKSICTHLSFSGRDLCFSGGDILFHSKKIGYDDCHKIDQEVKRCFPYYFKRYLQRYELKNPKQLQ